MGLDIRLPIGLMFLCLGPILLITGLCTATPINTYSGISMGLFGLVMLSLGLKGSRQNNKDAPDRH